jgi:tetratricopeptide (TPR) repeat protein
VQPGTSGLGDGVTASTPYLALVARYRDAVARGDEDAHMRAIEALVALPNGHSIDHAFKEYEDLAASVAGDANPGRLSASSRTVLAHAWEAVLPLAAVMHLETGYFLLQKDDANRAVAHLSIARSIVDWQPWARVIRIRADIEARHASLRRDIYIGIVWTLQTNRLLEPLQQHLARTREYFADDAMVLLALGSLEEVRGTGVEVNATNPPNRQMVIPRVAWRRLSQKARWEKAIEYYRAALKADPSLVEARVRLGRVLRLRGELKEARKELEAAEVSARASAPDPMPAFGPPMVMPYLKEMFLAEVIEEEGGAAAALTRYQDIVRRWPSCQSGLLALSRAYEARGDREAALNALHALFREQSNRLCVDPWWTYNLGQGWRFGPFVRDLRMRARGPS